MTGFHEKVKDLKALPAVDVGGHEYTGVYLAQLVAINSELLDAEAASTPQIVAELGRLSARAWRLKEEADLAYRRWREGTTFKLVADPAAAKAHDIPVRGQTPVKAAIDSFVRTLPEYAQHYAAKIATEEAWQTVNFALDAAKARSSVLRAMASERRQGSEPQSVGQPRISYQEDVAYPPVPPPPPRRNQ